ncbi:MAG: sigma-54-dependent Fis family transcriptional regulator [Deltaproteobacteria bacterium]|nr:sigma-54-dependent Fis family transcriptional regulator [Deltaproteobacteria bacterium]
MKEKSILIVDDEPSMRMALSESLISCGYDVETSSNGEEALRKFQKDKFQVVITDMRMPKVGGMDVLRGIKEKSPDTAVIVITAYGTVNTAVEAMKEGASDFIMKPFSLEHLEMVVKGVVAQDTGGDRTGMQETEGYASGGKEIITEDKRMRALLKVMETIAKSKSIVLIQGESGTGKELLARYIHRHSDRATMPFVAVNCAAIPGNLLESEMFGYEKGAFTGASQKKPGKFELADGGTLLLDEISEMDFHLQAKLLRIIQESEVDRLGGKSPVPVDVRIIATTNTDLKTRVSEKKFRDDLYYRLNVIPVTVPALREKRGDIALLAKVFLEKYCRLNGVSNATLSAEVINILEKYPWPGNVRELENIIERSVLLSGGCVICPEHLYLDGEDGGSRNEYAKRATLCLPGLIDRQDIALKDMTLREVEEQLICETLKRVGGNRTEASKILGVSVRTIRNKLNEYKSAGKQG